jgi:hypothetical protein
MGYFKSMIAQLEYTDETNEDEASNIIHRNELNLIQSKLLRLRLQILNYSLRNGYVLSVGKPLPIATS